MKVQGLKLFYVVTPFAGLGEEVLDREGPWTQELLEVRGQVPVLEELEDVLLRGVHARQRIRPAGMDFQTPTAVKRRTAR
jgi:hypothetical protein